MNKPFNSSAASLYQLSRNFILYIKVSLVAFILVKSDNLRYLKVWVPEDRIFNRVMSDISVVLREVTLTTLDSIGTISPVESEKVRLVSLGTTKITGITRSKKTNKKKNLQGRIP